MKGGQFDPPPAALPPSPLEKTTLKKPSLIRVNVLQKRINELLLP